MISSILFGLYIFVFIIQIYFILIQYKFINVGRKNVLTPERGVSVVVCAKNEQDNIPGLLESLSRQNYQNLEIILVNDGSVDRTLELFEEFSSNRDNVHVVDVKTNERFFSRKKYALSLGIKKASNEYLLFTDADCKPLSKNWVSEMSKGFSKGKELVLGYGAYERQKGLLNSLIRFETVTTAVNYFTHALYFSPYMGVGRNLAYTKNLFCNSGGFHKHLKVLSGDDDLFVNEQGNPENTDIVFSENSRTVSKPEESWKDWFVQKRRHYTTSAYYNTKSKFLLAAQSGSFALFIVLFFILMYFGYLPVYLLSLFLARTLLYHITFGQSANKLGEKDLIIFLPLFEILLLFLQVLIYASNKIIYPKRWA